ncbi:hypothetical protein YC2023_019139 [Brassica napus]
MNNKAFFFLLFSLVVLPLCSFTVVRVGGWSPISDAKDPHVVEIGVFAVSEYDKQSKSGLKFVTVVSGESQVAAGTNYRLIVTVDGSIGVAGAGVSKKYEAIVKKSDVTLTVSASGPHWGEKGREVKIGPCLSKGGAARGASTPARRLSLQRHSGSLTSSGLAREPSDQSDNGGGKMKGLFKSKPRTPADIVRQTRDLLLYADRSKSLPDLRESKREEKMAELSRNIRDMKSILYGNSEAEPVAEACAQLTQEFFREDTLRLLITCLPKLNLETRKDATQLVANLQRQQVNSRLIASDYLEANLDLMDVLMEGFENTDLALHYGAMFRECIRHQIVARYVLESEHVKKFFDYIQLPNFDIAADAAATFKELLTRHKSTVAEFLTKNEDWFFTDYNSKLLESSNYITRRQAIKLLGDILLDRSNSAVMTRYVSSRDNLRILMNLLRESSKSIQIEAFHVFKLFAANQNKPADIINILVANKSKLLRLLADLKPDKEDERFEADKSQVLREIAALEPRDLA